jgi:hypothetical protein
VNLHDYVPVLIFHILQAYIPQDSSIIDQNIYPSKALDSCIYYFLSEFDTIVIWDGNTSVIDDFFDDFVCGLIVDRKISCDFKQWHLLSMNKFEGVIILLHHLLLLH